MSDTVMPRHRRVPTGLALIGLAACAVGCARAVLVDVAPGARGVVVHASDPAPRNLLFRPEDAAVTELRDLLLRPEDARAAREQPAVR